MKRAFTLIELLVVIAIIAILAAILFPVFAQAKESAKQTQCIVQMKQVGIALTMYADDSDGYWASIANLTSAGPDFAPQNPWMGYDNKNAGRLGGWYGDMQLPAKNPIRPGMIDPYLKNFEVRQCPKRPVGAQWITTANWWTSTNASSYYRTNPNAKGNEYAPGAKRCAQYYAVEQCESANESEIEEPSYTATAWEHGTRYPGCQYLQGDDWFEAPPRVADRMRHFEFAHRDASVVIWADGHVKRMTYFQQKRPMFSVRKDIYR